MCAGRFRKPGLQDVCTKTGKKMNKFQRVKKIKCEDCGAPFFGIYGHYCDKCRKKRRQKKPMEDRVCPVCQMKKHMFVGQLICRECTFAMINKHDSEPRGIAAVEQRRHERKTGGKLAQLDTCPNFDAASITCATCEPGSWKFKDCGRKHD